MGGYTSVSSRPERSVFLFNSIGLVLFLTSRSRWYVSMLISGICALRRAESQQKQYESWQLSQGNQLCGEQKQYIAANLSLVVIRG
jgi:hypothetical protein